MFKAWVEEEHEKNVEFFATTNKERINVVSQTMMRQNIGAKLKKFINGVAQRHLKKGDGYVVTLSNSSIEQRSDETFLALSPFVKEKEQIGCMLLIRMWKNLPKKMGYFFDEHGLIVVCPCLEQQQLAKKIIMWHLLEELKQFLS